MPEEGLHYLSFGADIEMTFGSVVVFCNKAKKGWVVDHPPPQGIQLMLRRGRSPVDGEETEASEDAAESD